jgi:hypothetical protein
VADYFSAYLDLGGKVKRKDVPALINALNDQEFDDTPEIKGEPELLDLVNGGKRVLYQNEARWGHFDAVEALLKKLGLHYTVWSEDYGGNPASLEVTRPGADAVLYCSNGDQEVLVGAHDVIRLSNAILCASMNGDQAELRARQAELEDLCGAGDRLKLPPLEVTD